jgi:hypothetical protein
MDRYDFPFTQFSTFLLQIFSTFSSASADKTGRGEPVQVTRGRGADYVAYVYASIGSTIICRLYAINSFTPCTSHSATQSRSFRFKVKIFIRSALAGGPKNFSTGARTRCRRPYPQPLQMDEIGHGSFLQSADRSDHQPASFHHSIDFEHDLTVLSWGISVVCINNKVGKGSQQHN